MWPTDSEAPAGDRCGDVWPALLVPLRGGVRAAKAASDASAEAEFGAELERVLAVLRPACDDVA